MKLYAYCIAEGGLDRLQKIPRGVNGAKVRVMKIEDVSVLVSDCNRDLYPVRKNALAHNAVVRSVYKQTTPVPFRFAEVVTEQQLRDYVSTHRQAIKAQLSHVRGCAEMNVRMMGSVSSEEVSQTHKIEAGPGTTFLLEKRQEILYREAGATQQKQLSAWLREKLGKLIKDEKLSFVPSSSLKAFLARADHLVERGNIQEYRKELAKAIDERPEVRFMVSGPWPPYSFANIELEFKSHFGVS